MSPNVRRGCLAVLVAMVLALAAEACRPADSAADACMQARANRGMSGRGPSSNPSCH